MLQITGVLEISTANLEEAVISSLTDLGRAQYQDWRSGIAGGASHNGLFFIIPEDSAQFARVVAAFPESLRNCYWHARACGARYIMADPDNEPIEDLAIYDW